MAAGGARRSPVRVLLVAAAVAVLVAVGALVHLLDESAAGGRIAACRSAVDVQDRALREERIAYAAASGGYTAEARTVAAEARSYASTAATLVERCGR